MKKLLLAFFVFMLSGANYAHAANCSPNPYTLQNGQTADANQVMANFNNLQNCGNNQLLGKNNNLSDVQSSSTSRTNLGLGSVSTLPASGNGGYAATTNGGVNGNLVDFDGTGNVVDSGVAATDVLTKSGNLSGLASASTSRTNLGLGNSATVTITYSTSTPSGTANTGDLWYTYVP